MGRRKKRTKNSGHRSKPTTPSRIEWVGGRIVAPIYISEPEPYRPEVTIWFELGTELIVHFNLLDPDEPDEPDTNFVETLQKAMVAPMAGPPRRPSRVCVSDSKLAGEIRANMPDIEVEVGPTPELDELVRAMLEQMPDDDAEDISYFEGGTIPETRIAPLFRAAETLFHIAPWDVADDGQTLRLDIPALGVNGTCLSVVGALGESFGFIIFPSVIGYENFLAAATSDSFANGSIDLGTSTLSLNYERGADLPVSMRREAAEHAWPVASADAYPWIQHRDRDGTPRPLTEHDLRVVTACATSLSAFFTKHRAHFEAANPEPVCESYFDHDNLEVRFTMPFEADHLFEANMSSTPGLADATPSKVGRNSPCPCGSGKKYKKCCLRKDEGARDEMRGPALVHRLDERLNERIVRFAVKRFGDVWLEAAGYFQDVDEEVQLFVPWAIYHAELEGKQLIHWFFESECRRLSSQERGWIEAQQAAWLSVWEATDVEPGVGMTLLDLLTGEERNVHEANASQVLVQRDAVLARVVDFHGETVICGCHSRSLPPGEAAEVVRQVRGRLRRKSAVPIERLRGEKIGRYLIDRWEEALEEFDDGNDAWPALHNTDGDDLLITTEHYEFDATRGKEIGKRLAAIDGVLPPEGGDEGYVFLRPSRERDADELGAVVGRAELTGGKLRLESTSVARADSLKERVEAACGDLIRHRARDLVDPFVLAEQEPALPADAPEELDPEIAQQLVLDFKDRHYADWVNQPVPALDDKTPRAMAKTKAGRPRVELLIKEFENHEARLPEAERFDFSRLRATLGLAASFRPGRR